MGRASLSRTISIKVLNQVFFGGKIVQDVVLFSYMEPIDLGSYKSIYLQTAKEYINSMSLSCNKLTNNALDKEALNNLHIASHSLRSQSQVMGFTDIANICLSIEKMSDDALKGIVQLNNETISEIEKSVGQLKEMLKQVENALRGI